MSKKTRKDCTCDAHRRIGPPIDDGTESLKRYAEMVRAMKRRAKSKKRKARLPAAAAKGRKR